MRAVDDYVVHPWGLYVARPTPGRAQFHYLESWLLPSLGLRATVFHFNPGHERDHDYYLDLGEYTPGPGAWSSEDHYIALHTGRGDFAKGQPLNHIGVEVDSLDAVEAKVVAAGLTPFGHDNYEPGRRFYFLDPDGIEFEVVSYNLAVNS